MRHARRSDQTPHSQHNYNTYLKGALSKSKFHHSFILLIIMTSAVTLHAILCFPMNIWISPPDMRARTIPCLACYLSSTSHRINASAMHAIDAMPERRRLLCTQTKPQILMTLMPFPEASGEKQSCPRKGTYHHCYIQQRMKELPPL